MTPKSLWIRRLVQSLLDVANGDAPLALAPGVLRDADGLPRLKVADLPTTTETRDEALALLAALIEPDGHHVLEAQINARGGLRLSVFGAGPREHPALVVPRIDGTQSPARAILGLALITPTPQGDSLCSRIHRCDRCQRWFIANARRLTQRFCARNCRWLAAVVRGKQRRVDDDPPLGFPTATPPPRLTKRLRASSRSN